MRLWVKLGLFLSAYLPLFLILVIKHWYDVRLVILFVAVLVYSGVWLVLIFYSKKGNSTDYRVVQAENRTKESMNYIIPYIIAFLTVDIDKWQDCLSIIILLLILFIIYIHSELLYVNPILTLFKYRIFEIHAYEKNLGDSTNPIQLFVLTRNENIEQNEEITLKEIDGSLTLGGKVNAGYPGNSEESGK